MLDDDNDDDRHNRIKPYDDLFNAISENKRIENGLKSILAMEAKCSPAIRELAQAVLEEIEFYRNRRRQQLFDLTSLFKKKNPEPQVQGPQFVVQVEKSQEYICDPIVLKMCQAVLEEIKHIRDQRIMTERCGYACIPLVVLVFIMATGLLIWGFVSFFKHITT